MLYVYVILCALTLNIFYLVMNKISAPHVFDLSPKLYTIWFCVKIKAYFLNSVRFFITQGVQECMKLFNIKVLRKTQYNFHNVLCFMPFFYHSKHFPPS